MKSRVLSIGVLLAIFLLFIVGIQGSNANQAVNTDRKKTVEIQVTQYVWELVSNRDGRVICQVIVEHPNQPSNTEAIQICGDQIFPVEPTPTPINIVPIGTPEPVDTQPFDLAAFFRSVSWRFVTTQELRRTIEVSVPEMIVNLAIPPGQTTRPFFVTITAYEPVYGQQITGIFGILNGLEFRCTGPRCDVPVDSDAILEFWATSSMGDESRHSEAAFRIARVENQVTLELVSLVPITIFQDSCAAIWGLPLAGLPSWAGLPAAPDDLNTIKPYQYLAGELISAGVVSARDCPGGGLGASGGPNTCGLERAANAVIEWQNRFDVAIWEAGRSYGIPPILLKTMIAQESQFWPGNARRALFEYGLGQLSPVGTDVLLRWDNEQFATTCNGLLYDCSQSYGRQESWFQAMLRGGLMRSLDAECPTCLNGIDLQRTYDSIPVFTRTLRANCRQTKFVMDKARARASYEDLWKFTFLSYHSGYSCLADALAYTGFNQQPYDWTHLSVYLTGFCENGLYYVNDFWKELESFDAYRLKTPASTQPVVQPVFAETPVPTATPTPVLAMSHIRVLVYVDQNNNNIPDRDEGANGVSVTATFADGQVASASTVNGEVIFDLTGRPIGGDVLVSLPELFRSARVRIMRDGEIPVIFRLEQPVVPPVLP
jgi:hypothetical protein